MDLDFLDSNYMDFSLSLIEYELHLYHHLAAL
jgi:hypothetical protein